MGRSCPGPHPIPRTSIRMRLQTGSPRGKTGRWDDQGGGCALTSRILASFRLFLSSREAWRKHSRLPRISSVFSCRVAWKCRLRKRVLYSGTDSICHEGKARIHPPHQETHRPTTAWGGGHLAARHSLKKNKHNPNISTKNKHNPIYLGPQVGTGRERCSTGTQRRERSGGRGEGPTQPRSQREP